MCLIFNATFIILSVWKCTCAGCFNEKIITHILDIVFITRSNFFLSEINLKFFMEFLVLMFLIGQRSVGRWSVGRLVDGLW